MAVPSFSRTRFRSRYVHINVNVFFSFKSLKVRKLWHFSFKLRFSSVHVSETFQNIFEIALALGEEVATLTALRSSDG